MSRIDYPLEKIKAIVFDIDGVLSPATVALRDNGIPRRQANLKDGLAMVEAIKAGLKIMILSGASSPGVRERFARIGVTEFHEGRVDKLPVLKDFISSNGLMPEEVAYVGDDLLDLDAMRYVGLPISPSDGSRDTKEVARYITEAQGGYGVGREVIEEIMRAQMIWPTIKNSVLK